MITSHTHSAEHAYTVSTAGATGQTARTGADMSLIQSVSIGGRARNLTPYAFVAQTGGLVVLENADGATSAIGITAVAGVVYPLSGSSFKPITVLDDANTTADEITFFYTR